jgi:hypothetical protein
MLEEMISAAVLSLLSAAIHALGLLWLLYWQTKQWPRIEAEFRPRRNLPVVLVVYCAIVILHLAEIGLWAGYFSWRRCLPDFETCLYFSASSYSTVGYGDIVLNRTWRLVGVGESITGALLLGWSAAFFFAVMHHFFEIRIRRWQKE